MSDLPKYNELPPGGIIPEPSTSLKYYTGDWRVERPIIDQDKCVRCRLCWIYCPDNAIRELDQEYETSKGRKYKLTYIVDYNYCKGCGICAQECPVDAIKMIPELVEGGEEE